MNFPLFKTKIAGVSRKFNLNDPEARREYFQLKAGTEIEKLQKYLAERTFIGYLLGKKNSGKGTYSKLFMEAVSRDKIGHVSVGDVVRDVHAALENKKGKNQLVEFLRASYRGFHSIEEIIDIIEGRSTETLVPTELIVSLLKFEISKRPRQAIFIDGFPRGLDQISYSLYLKELLGYRDDPDFFVFINLPDTIIDERIKYRVICPICKTPRSTKLLATSEAGYDEASGVFYLKCDTPECNSARLVPKEGDELGIEPIRARLETDDQIMKKLLGLQGVPKIYLRNSIPADVALQYADEYELTPEYYYERGEDGQVKILERPWVVKDDDGTASYSLLPPAIVISFIKQAVSVLGL